MRTWGCLRAGASHPLVGRPSRLGTRPPTVAPTTRHGTYGLLCDPIVEKKESSPEIERLEKIKSLFVFVISRLWRPSTGSGTVKVGPGRKTCPEEVVGTSGELQGPCIEQITTRYPLKIQSLCALCQPIFLSLLPFAPCARGDWDVLVVGLR